MNKEDEVFAKFVEFKALVKNETSQKIKSLRSDNGGEFVSNAFKEFCAKEGIRRELIAPHKPQQNGVTKTRDFIETRRQMNFDVIIAEILS